MVSLGLGNKVAAEIVSLAVSLLTVISRGT
jgi:hypothetical protein